ncbi:hypothetical protein BGZ80_002637, partial [Entomortierella chlamydospora]
ATSQQNAQSSEKRVRFKQCDLDAKVPGNPFDHSSDNSESFRPDTTEDSTGEFSAMFLIEPDFGSITRFVNKIYMRLVRLNELSSWPFRLDKKHWFSVTLDSPQRIIRLVGPSQESSSLFLDHWMFKEQDVSRKLMRNRAELD